MYLHMGFLDFPHLEWKHRHLFAQIPLFSFFLFFFFFFQITTMPFPFLDFNRIRRVKRFIFLVFIANIAMTRVCVIVSESWIPVLITVCCARYLSLYATVQSVEIKEINYATYNKFYRIRRLILGVSMIWICRPSVDRSPCLTAWHALAAYNGTPWDSS